MSNVQHYNRFFDYKYLPDFINVSDVLCLEKPYVNLVSNFVHTFVYVFQKVRDLVELVC